MVRSLLLCCCIFITGVKANTQKSRIRQCPLGPEWSLAEMMSDEFEGLSLDQSKWWDFNPSWVGRKPAYFDRGNVDGEEIFRRVNDYFHRPLYIVFDAEIMEDWMGLPDRADLPSVFTTDYVRVWQRQ